MSLDLSHIRVLSFDLDDTLWDGHSVILSAEKSMHDWMLDHTPKVFERFSKDTLREHKFEFIKHHPHLINKISLARQAYLSELFSQLNYSDYQQKSEACFKAFYQARQNVTLFQGVAEALARLKKHYPLIAITNGNADIQLTGLGDFFEFSLKAEDFDRPKPHGDIFHQALQQANINADQCLHIGDHPVHDMQGAYDMGMKTCWLKDGKREWNQDFTAHLEITHISELLPILIKNTE